MINMILLVIGIYVKLMSYLKLGSKIPTILIYTQTYPYYIEGGLVDPINGEG